MTLIRIGELVRHFRFGSVASATEEGRANERERRILLSALANVAARFIGIGIALLLVPLLIDYLGVEGYGLWATLTSSIAFLAVADLGFGNSLTNAISETYADNDKESARRFIVSSSAILLFVSGIFLIGFLLLYPFVRWADFFNVESNSLRISVGPATAAIAVIFILRVPFGLVRNIRLGLQESYVNSFWQLIASVLGLCGLIYAIQFRMDMYWLIIAMFGAAILSDIMNTAFLMRREKSWLRFDSKSFSPRTARVMFSVGFQFFIIQIANVAAYQTDSLIIVRMLGPEYVTEFVVPQRLFMLASIVIAFALYPMWPAYGEAIARQDFDWTRKILKKSFRYSVGFTSIYVIFLWFWADEIIHLWVAGVVEPSTLLVAGMGLWALINSATFPLTMFMNGANLIQFQAVASVCMAISNVLLSVFLVRRIGVAGAIFGTAISMGVFLLLPSLILIKRRLFGEHVELSTFSQSTE